MTDKVRRIDYSPDEMIAGVVGQMSARDFGVYWMVCTLIYSRGKAIPDDAKYISGMFADTNPRTVRAALDHLIKQEKIIRNDAELMVNRCRTELERASNRVRTARENGLKGGRPSNQNNDLEKAGGSPDKKLTINEQPSTTNVTTTGAKSRAVSKRGSRITDEWQPSEKAISFGVEKGFTKDEICGRIREEFIDYWIAESGQRASKVDWDRTFQNRLRDLLKYGRGSDRGSRPQRGGNSGKRSAILAAAAIGLDRGGREHGEPGDAVADVRDAGSGGSGAGGGGDSGGDGSGKPRGRAEGLDQAAAGDKGAGHGPGRNGDGERSDFRGADGFSGGRGAGCVIDVEPDGDIFSAAGRDSGSVSPENGQPGAPSCGDDAGAGESGRSAVIDLDVLRRMG